MTLTKNKKWGQFFADPFFNEVPAILNRDNHEVFPAINLIENKKNYEIELAAPGFKKDDFKVEMENGVLKIYAESEEEKVKEDKNYKRREFTYNSFERSFNVPDDIDENSVDAEYKDGILRLSIKKLEDKKIENKKRISVH